MIRGDIIAAAGGGDFMGQPRPALIVQSELFLDEHPSVTICPISSHLTGNYLFRILIEKDQFNGLRNDSEVEVDKITTIWSRRIGSKIGRASDPVLLAVDTALRRWLDL